MTAALPIPPGGAVVTVGSFDGLHLGHRRVLDDVLARARARERAALLVTFEPHPAEVLRPAQAPLRLTLADERRELLAQVGLDGAAVLGFDRRLAARSAAEFVREVLVRRFRCRELVVGPDHGLGRGREGGAEMLRELGAGLGFDVDVVPPVVVDGEQVSSTRIRALIAGGRLDEAARGLGRRYSVSAAVVAGAGRGRGLGVPTANLAVPARKQLPPDGVYAVRVEWAGGVVGGMLNQGPRPTFGDGQRILEANLFGFDGSLYGRMIRVTWMTRLREVRRFESVEALRAQLEADRRAAQDALAAAGTGQDP